MTDTTTQKPATPNARFDNLATIDRGLAELALRPKGTVYVVTAIAVALAWVWLTFLTAGLAAVDETALGPGMAGWLGWLQEFGANPSDNTLLAAILKICTPAGPGAFGLTVYLATVAMWMAMSLAMMLPSAMPMMRTYADIADVAAGKGEKAVPLIVLVLGYLSIWLAFSFAAAAIQFAIAAIGGSAEPLYPVQGLIGGAILIVAGAYQFSALKNACLEKCRNPFSILFGRWTTRPTGVFKLGIEQGMFCLGCCWALMLVMLVVGTMNLAWMAFFTLFAIAEKSGRGKVTSHLSGGILLAWGAVLSIASAMSV